MVLHCCPLSLKGKGKGNIKQCLVGLVDPHREHSQCISISSGCQMPQVHRVTLSTPRMYGNRSMFLLTSNCKRFLRVSADSVCQTKAYYRGYIMWLSETFHRPSKRLLQVWTSRMYRFRLHRVVVQGLWLDWSVIEHIRTHATGFTCCLGSGRD